MDVLPASALNVTVAFVFGMKVQCDQMARLFLIFGHLGTKMKICPIASIIGKKCHNILPINCRPKNCQRSFYFAKGAKFCPRGEILPNLVTLNGSSDEVNQMRSHQINYTHVLLCYSDRGFHSVMLLAHREKLMNWKRQK